MFENPIIDVVLGLISFYVISSLVVSSIQEGISSWLGWRSKNLKRGIESFVGNKYAEEIYNHPVIQNLTEEKRLPSFLPKWTWLTNFLFLFIKRRYPSYISTKRLSSLYLNIIGVDKLDNVGDVLDKIDDKQPIKKVLEHILCNGEHNIDALRDGLAEWFDEGMERISGWYKRKTQCATFFIALALAGMTNSDSLLLAKKLWEDKALRTMISLQAQNMSQEKILISEGKDKLSSIKKFPLGWNSGNAPQGFWRWARFCMGITLTAFAISLGAPFWFDLLSKVARLKGSGGHKPPDSHRK